MERAVSVATVNNLNQIKPSYSRLYFGPEFCQYLLPTTKEFLRVLKIVQERGVEFTLVTPFVTNEGLVRVEELLLILVSGGFNTCEVVFNDWGVLHLLEEHFHSLKPIMGRLLTKQIRDPRIPFSLNISPVMYSNISTTRDLQTSAVSISLKSYFQETNINVPIIQQFLKVHGINRAELDYPLQGINLASLPVGLSASAYVPFVYVTTTRRCPVNTEYRQAPFTTQIGNCKRECLSTTIELRSKYLPKVLYLRGNTQFYKNNSYSIRHLAELGFDRLVYQPTIPA